MPVYNTSKYLERCLNSLAKQTLKDLEVIIVDDGSSDNSGLICDIYANRYHNFKVIHQSNKGSALARQAGLDVAKGEYIIVCDSDDWVEPDMYEKLYKAAKLQNADMVLCGFYCEYPDGRSIPTQKWFSHLDFEGHVKELMGSTYNNSWIRLIRRSLFINNNIRYEPNINLGEDALILYKILKYKPKIIQINEKLYHYRKIYGSSSYTNSITMSQIYKSIHIREWIKNNYDNTIFAEGIYRLTINHIFTCLRARDTNRKYVNNILKTELSWSKFFKYKKFSKAIIVYMSKLFPIMIISSFIKILYKYIY